VIQDATVEFPQPAALVVPLVSRSAIAARSVKPRPPGSPPSPKARAPPPRTPNGRPCSPRSGPNDALPRARTRQGPGHSGAAGQHSREGLTRAEIVKEMDRSANEIYRMLERLVVRQYVLRSASGRPLRLEPQAVCAGPHASAREPDDQPGPAGDGRVRPQGRAILPPGRVRPGQRARSAHRSTARAAGVFRCNGVRGLACSTPPRATLLLAFCDPASHRRMRETAPPWKARCQSPSLPCSDRSPPFRRRGYLQRSSAQSFAVTDISVPVLGPDNTALAALTCPYIRRSTATSAPT